jgi:hypothetical protein
MDVTSVSGLIGKSSTHHIKFHNPFDCTSQVTVCLHTEDTTPPFAFMLLLDAQQSAGGGLTSRGGGVAAIVEPFGVLEIPFAFSPSALLDHHYECRIEVAATNNDSNSNNNNNDSGNHGIVWTFPIAGVPCVIGSKTAFEIQGKARTRVEQVLLLPLPGLPLATLTRRPSSTFSSTEVSKTLRSSSNSVVENQDNFSDQNSSEEPYEDPEEGEAESEEEEFDNNNNNNDFSVQVIPLGKQYLSETEGDNGSEPNAKEPDNTSTLALQRAFMAFLKESTPSTVPATDGTNETAALSLNAVFVPFRSLNGMVEIQISKTSCPACTWLYQVHLVSTSIDGFDDELVIDVVAPNKPAGVAFKLVNPFDYVATFRAYFTTQQTTDVLAVTPKTGTIEPTSTVAGSNNTPSPAG